MLALQNIQCTGAGPALSLPKALSDAGVISNAGEATFWNNVKREGVPASHSLSEM